MIIKNAFPDAVAFGHLKAPTAGMSIDDCRIIDLPVARRTGEDDQDIYFEYDKFDFAAAREHFLTVLTEPES